jgi:hypothetical protein
MTEEVDQHRDKRRKMEGDSNDATEVMEVDRPTQPTNHDRSVLKEESTTPNITAPEITVESTDNGSLDQLEKDMGDAFLLGRSSKFVLHLFLTCINIVFQSCSLKHRDHKHICLVYMV